MKLENGIVQSGLEAIAPPRPVKASPTQPLTAGQKVVKSDQLLDQVMQLAKEVLEEVGNESRVLDDRAS